MQTDASSEELPSPDAAVIAVNYLSNGVNAMRGLLPM
jgi:hypothetical protein